MAPGAWSWGKMWVVEEHWWHRELCGHPWRLCALELQSERKVGQRGEESEGELKSSVSTLVQGKSERERVGTRGCNGGACSAAWLPHHHCIEHMAGAAQPVLEAIFGQATLQTGPWPKTKVAYLRILFKFH
jgi:hypothetical protein